MQMWPDKVCQEPVSLMSSYEVQNKNISKAKKRKEKSQIKVALHVVKEKLAYLSYVLTFAYDTENYQENVAEWIIGRNF